MARARNEWPLVQRETFAPSLYLMTYQELDEALAMQNAVSRGIRFST